MGYIQYKVFIQGFKSKTYRKRKYQKREIIQERKTGQESIHSLEGRSQLNQNSVPTSYLLPPIPKSNIQLTIFFKQYPTTNNHNI